MVETAVKVRKILLQHGIDVTIVNARFVKPIDEELIEELAQNHSLLVTMEENVEHGGYGQSVASFICDHNLDLRHINISVKDNFVEHGKVYELYQRLGLDPQSVYEKIIESL